MGMGPLLSGRYSDFLCDPSAAGEGGYHGHAPEDHGLLDMQGTDPFSTPLDLVLQPVETQGAHLFEYLAMSPELGSSGHLSPHGPGVSILPLGDDRHDYHSQADTDTPLGATPGRPS